MTFDEYEYPKWAEVMGLLISCSSMIWVVIYALYFLITTPGTLMERLKTGITPIFDKKQELNSGSGPWDPKEAERLVEQPITIA